MNVNQLEKIRNFSIIAHIDHGKSTLADRMLEAVKTDLSREKRKTRVLDRLDLEQEKGITIKLQACRMNWKGYQLNLIDTPGHVDFSYEVSRSLAACDSAILLVDASQGIQAQTISNTKKALELGLKIIPVLNKIDIPYIDIDEKEKEIEALLGFSRDEIIKISGKTGENVDLLLDTIVERAPQPKGNPESPLKALVFDSFYDEHRGVVIAVRIFDGKIEYIPGKPIELYMIQRQGSFKPTEIGMFSPNLEETQSLETGEVGYIATGEKDISYFTVGDTVSDRKDTQPLEGYKIPKPNMFASFFPTEPEEYEGLKTALRKLSLNDSSITFAEQRSSLLGSGFRCGFLGLLHMEIVQERLEREYDVSLIVTAPTVEYKILKTDGTEVLVQTPDEFPNPAEIEEVFEPWVRTEILAPDKYLGDLMKLCQFRRGQYVNTKYLDTDSSLNLKEQYVSLEYDIPLASLISNFFDQMRNISSGYASMSYELIDFFPSDIVKVSILVNHKEVEALSFLEENSQTRSKAVKLLEEMKKVIPRQQFPIPLQAAIGSKIIAREDVKAFRKDVTAKLYGGDYSRKKKLLEKQKKGKKRLKQIGEVTLPQEAFLAILKT
ncbi:MAG: translation elongation factor 4 [Candidatus Dojkabacteria bacterium]|nr:translation elongation factor 4 [Candidatus Dojkabacteria bacterium]MDD4560966.1 translation elongation factor 4 [Candidatus Dojkabacteria bacterium]